MIDEDEYDDATDRARRHSLPPELRVVLERAIEPVTMHHECEHAAAMEVIEAAWPVVLDYLRANLTLVSHGLHEQGSLYVELPGHSEGTVSTEEIFSSAGVTQGINVDYDNKKNIVGVEVLGPLVAIVLDGSSLWRQQDAEKWEKAGILPPPAVV